MSFHKSRFCPLCAGKPTGLTFPYKTRFNDVHFGYLKCSKCKSVYVDPVPDALTFARMYAKSAYHDQFYDGSEGEDYQESVRLLSKHLKPGLKVLDYGCGLGWFLKACKSHGFVPFGVEFNNDAAQFAAKNADCEALTVEAFSQLANSPIFDAIHMGDVLEHLSDPLATVSHLLKFLKPGGVLYIEGPLEINPSLVYWSALIFGVVKRLFKPTFLSSHPPTHLFRTDAAAQKSFFENLNPRLTMNHWEVYESGWPYVRGGVIKRSISALAVLMGGREFAGMTFGNRFKAILIKL